MCNPISRYLQASLLGLACTMPAFSAGAGQDMSEWPDWLKESMQKEAESARTSTVKFADDNYAVQLPGTPAEPQAFEAGWYLQSDIGSSAPLECYLFTNESDLATLAVQLSDVNIELMSDNYGAVDKKHVYHLDAGAIDGVPYFALDWMYTVGTAPETLMAMTKVRVAANGDVVQACSHNEIGYRETLASAFDTFVRSAEFPSAAMEPYYREVAVMRFDEQPVGLIWLSYARDADGDTEVEYHDAQILPVDASTIQSSDTTSMSFSTPDGVLINEVSASSENGELTTYLELTRDADDAWLVSGTFQGKELTATLDGNVVPLSPLGQQFRAQELLLDEAERVSFEAWLPQADPTSFLTATIERLDGDGGNNARMLMGPIAMDVDMDDTGSIRSGSIQVGPALMTIERVFVDGKAR